MRRVGWNGSYTVLAATTTTTTTTTTNRFGWGEEMGIDLSEEMGKDLGGVRR